MSQTQPDTRRGNGRLRRRAAAIALLPVLLAGCMGADDNGDGQADSPAPTSEVVTDHETIGFSEIGAPVAFVDELGNAGTITVHSASRRPSSIPSDEAAEWLVLDVSVEATAGQVSVSVWEFHAQTADGRTFDAVATPTEAVFEATLTPGRLARGEIGIDAPVGQLLVDWAPVPGLPPLATFEVDG